MLYYTILFYDTEIEYLSLAKARETMVHRTMHLIPSTRQSIQTMNRDMEALWRWNFPSHFQNFFKNIAASLLGRYVLGKFLQCDWCLRRHNVLSLIARSKLVFIDGRVLRHSFVAPGRGFRDRIVPSDIFGTVPTYKYLPSGYIGVWTSHPGQWTKRYPMIGARAVLF